MSELSFYGEDQAIIHDRDFGHTARHAAATLLKALREAGHETGTIVDLGCGSGILAGLLCDAGYAVHGFDISPHMVELARVRAPAARLECCSLHDAVLPRAVAVTAIGEALNYATDPRAGLDELGRLAARVREALAPGGVFLFDVATPGRNGPDLVRQQFHDRDDWTLYMHAEETPDDATLRRKITVFRKVDDEHYRRSDERHVLRLYEPEAVLGVLDHAGFDAQLHDTYGTALPALPGWIVVLATPRVDER